MTIPTITEYQGLVPDRRTQEASVFTGAAITWTDYQASNLVPDINATVFAMNGVATQVSADADLAQSSAEAAQAAGNYQGVWTVGATVLKGQTWSYDNYLWISNIDDAGQPQENASWQLMSAARAVKTKTSQSVQGFIDSFSLDVFQSPTDGLTKVKTRTLLGGEIYDVRKVSDDSLATIYSDAAGTAEIVQNGTSNVSGSDGVAEFFVDDGDFYILADTVRSDLKVRANIYSTVELLKSGSFDVGSTVKIDTRGDVEFDIVNGGTPDGNNVLDAGDGNTAVQKPSKTGLTNGRVSKKATMSIIFDDGYISAGSTVRALLDSKGVRAGFALNPARLGNQLQRTKIQTFLEMQEDGHEILNHGHSHVLINSASDNASLVESEINGSLFLLRSWGLNVNGYVAAQSRVHITHKPILEKHHSFAFTTASVDSVSSAAFQDDDLDDYLLHRSSSYNMGVSNVKSLIDLAVEEKGSIVLTEHDPDQTYYLQSLTIADWTEILDYAIASGIEIVTPSEMMQQISAGFIQKEKLGKLKYEIASRENLINDCNFGTIESSALSAWAIDDTLTNKATFSYDEQAGNTLLNLTIPSGNTSGRVLLTNDSKVYDSNVNKWGLVSAQIDAYGTLINSNDNVQVNFGIRFIYESNNAVVASDEIIDMYLDETNRTYSVSADTNNNTTPFFIRYYISVSPKNTSGDTVTLSRPMLYQGKGRSMYSESKNKPKNENLTLVEATVLSSGVYTTLGLADKSVAQVNIENNRVYVKESGAYSFDISVAIADAAMVAGSRGIIAMTRNGSSSRQSPQNCVSGDGLLTLTMSKTLHLNRGEYVQFVGWQSTTPSVATQNAGLSHVSVIKLD